MFKCTERRQQRLTKKIQALAFKQQSVCPPHEWEGDEEHKAADLICKRVLGKDEEGKDIVCNTVVSRMVYQTDTTRRNKSNVRNKQVKEELVQSEGT